MAICFSLFYLKKKRFIYVYVCTRTCARAHIWRSEVKLWGSLYLTTTWVSRGQTQVVRLHQKHLCLLSCLPALCYVKASVILEKVESAIQNIQGLLTGEQTSLVMFLIELTPLLSCFWAQHLHQWLYRLILPIIINTKGWIIIEKEMS